MSSPALYLCKFNNIKCSYPQTIFPHRKTLKRFNTLSQWTWQFYPGQWFQEKRNCGPTRFRITQPTWILIACSESLMPQLWKRKIRVHSNPKAAFSASRYFECNMLCMSSVEEFLALLSLPHEIYISVKTIFIVEKHLMSIVDRLLVT